jgi:hypothetical protein
LEQLHKIFEGALMETLFRLDTVSQSLGESIRRANEQQRRRATLAVCLDAVARVGLEGDEVEVAIDLLRHGENVQPSVLHELNSLAAQFDEEYFKLSVESHAATPKALFIFRKARAAAALAFAISREAGQLHEALYEAIIASEDQPEAIRTACAALNEK